MRPRAAGADRPPEGVSCLTQRVLLRDERRAVAPPATHHRRDDDERDAERQRTDAGVPHAGVAARQGQLAVAAGVVAATGPGNRGRGGLVRRRLHGGGRRRGGGGRGGRGRGGRRRRRGRRRRLHLALDLHELLGEDVLQQVRDHVVLAVGELVDHDLAVARLDPEVHRVRLVAVRVDGELLGQGRLVLVEVLHDDRAAELRVLAALVGVDRDVRLVEARLLGGVALRPLTLVVALVGRLADDGLAGRQLRNGQDVDGLVTRLVRPLGGLVVVAPHDDRVAAAGAGRLRCLRQVEVRIGDDDRRARGGLGGLRRTGERNAAGHESRRERRGHESPTQRGESRHKTQSPLSMYLFL